MMENKSTVLSRFMNTTLALASLFAASMLSGCSGTTEALGLDRKPIDEFQIVTRAPLTIPPDYMLQPPAPGAPRPQETPSRDVAASLLLGAASERISPEDMLALRPDTLSTGELSLLERTGGLNADPAIRQRLAVEAMQPAAEPERGYLEFLNPFSRETTGSDVLDPQAEQERLIQQEPAPADEPEL